MKKINGFTLVELLATIVIIGVVAIIVVPTVINNIEEARIKLYETQIQNVELSAKKWATENRKELDNEYLNPTFISLTMLKDTGFLTNEKIKNPSTGGEMNGCIKISYDYDNKIYKYKYDGKNISCNDKTEKGYYYTKKNNIWEKDLTHQINSIYSYLVGSEQENIVSSGSGLYDMENRYVFRGRIENNYVKLDGAYFRIISLDKNSKSLKLISTDKNGSGVWGNTTNISLNTTTLYTETINKQLYSNVINHNVKWNIGKITETNNLNLNAVRTYESKSQIDSEIALITMSEYMESSIDGACAAGNLASCANETYLNIPDSWTMTTTENTVAYINSNKALAFESDLANVHHNIYRVLNIKTMEKIGTGTYNDPFIITTE